MCLAKQRDESDMLERYTYEVISLAEKGDNLTLEESRKLIKSMGLLFKEVAESAGYNPTKVKAWRTKLRDAGRRSAPWQPVSSRVPGRPQDGSDGNRINRWLLSPDHKFYADEKTATLVEVKYYLQLFSMTNAPRVMDDALENKFEWLIEHPVKPGQYRDPITLVEIDFNEILETPALLQSGHIYPLDRGGRHQPTNTFLMTKRSNALQGNMTVNELLDYILDILKRHGRI